MAKYIDAERAERNGWYLQRTVTYSTAVTGGCGYTETLKPTDYPAADVLEVQHGKWVEADDFYESGVCSKCGCNSGELHGVCVKEWHYCPNCGASMMDDNATQHTECVENALGALAELENGIYGVRDGQVYKMRCATPEELFPNAKKYEVNLMATTEEEE